MIKYVEGDLFGSAEADVGGTIVIPHVCNDKGAWGSGFVVPLGRRFPAAKERYHRWCQQKVDDLGNKPFQLGQTQIVPLAFLQGRFIIVANMLAQTLGGKRPLYYQYLAMCMEEVARYCRDIQKKDTDEIHIHAPAFGAGLACGDWNIIKELIEDTWIRDSKFSVTIYYLPGTVPQVEAEAKKVAHLNSGIKLDPGLEAEIAQALADEPSILTNLQHRLETEVPQDDTPLYTEVKPFKGGPE